MTTVTLPDGSTASFPDDMSHDDMISVIKQHLSQNPQSPPPSGPVAAAQGWLNIMNGAQQGTSPIVRDNHGNLNYTRLGNPITTDAGPGYVDSEGKWQILDSTRHVMLTDPATGHAGVFERNKDMDMGPAESLGQVLPLGVLSGAPAVAGATRLPGQTSTVAKVAASPVTKYVGNAASGYGAAKFGQLTGLPDIVSGMLGTSLGLGSHASGMGGQVLDNIAKWFSQRAAAGAPAVPAVNYAAPFSVPGLLGTTEAVAGGGVMNQPPYGYPYSTP